MDLTLDPVVKNGVWLEVAPLIRQALSHKEAGEFATAIQLLTGQFAEFSSSVELLSLLTHCYILDDDAENASIYLAKAKAIDPHHVLVSWNEVRLLMKNKNVPDALVVARKTIERYPDDIEGMGVIGACLRVSNKIEDSLIYLDRAIFLNPNYAEALINRGLIKLTRNDKPGALSDLETAHKLKPHIRQIWDLVISLNLELKQFGQAKSFLVKMVEVDPSNVKNFMNLAFCNQTLGDLESAIDNYKQVLKVNPDFAEAYYNMGILLNEGGDLEGAIHSYQQAVSIQPTHAQAYYNMGNVLRRCGDFEAAIDRYKQALKIKPDYAQAYYNIGNSLRDRGDLEAAIESYKQSLKIDPDYAEAYNNLGLTQNDKGDRTAAIDSYNKAVQINPDYADAYYNLGLLPGLAERSW